MKKKVEFKRVKQPTDGNCFFSSVSYLLNYYKIYDLSPSDLRKLVSNYHVKHKNEKRHQIVKIKGNWATHEDVIAMSNVLKINIKVWETANNMWITFGEYTNKIYILNTGNVHFDALIRL